MCKKQTTLVDFSEFLLVVYLHSLCDTLHNADEKTALPTCLAARSLQLLEETQQACRILTR